MPQRLNRKRAITLNRRKQSTRLQPQLAKLFFINVALNSKIFYRVNLDGIFQLKLLSTLIKFSLNTSTIAHTECPENRHRKYRSFTQNSGRET